MNRFLLSSILVVLSCVSVHAQPVVTEFRAVLDADFIQPNTALHQTSTASATANFVLTHDPSRPADTTLTYNIEFDNLDITPLDGSPINNPEHVTAVHFHDTTTCVNPSLCGDGNGGLEPGLTAGTRHVLNVYRAPREDDNDLQIFADEERLAGIWDPTDANNLTPAPSESIADPAVLDLLFGGELAIVVHTNRIVSGEIGGFIVPVPEPGVLTLVTFAVGVFAVGRRR